MTKRKTGMGSDAFFQAQPEQLDSTTVKQQASKPAKQRAQNATAVGQYINGPKTKVTNYLSDSAIEGIDEALPQLKRLAGKENRQLVTKSLVVEIALQLALIDLEENGTDSKLAKKVADTLRIA